MRYWLRISDPDFEKKIKDVIGVYLAAPKWAERGIAAFSVDEKTSIQALERKFPDRPMIRGIPQLREFEYTRHGTLRLTGSFNIAYDPKLHRNGKLRRAFLTSPDKRVVFHFTPRYASWLNQIEIWFGVLCRKLLRRESFASLDELEAAILGFIETYNRHLAHPYRWTYTGTPCRA